MEGGSAIRCTYQSSRSPAHSLAAMPKQFPLFEKATRDNLTSRSLGDKLQSAFQAIVTLPIHLLEHAMQAFESYRGEIAIRPRARSARIRKLRKGRLTERTPERPVLVAQLPDNLDVTLGEVVHARRELDCRSRESRSRGCFDWLKRAQTPKSVVSSLRSHDAVIRRATYQRVRDHRLAPPSWPWPSPPLTNARTSRPSPVRAVPPCPRTVAGS